MLSPFPVCAGTGGGLRLPDARSTPVRGECPPRCLRPQAPRWDWPLASLNARRSVAADRSSSRRVGTSRQGLAGASALVLVLACCALLAPSAGARAGRDAAQPYVELCGPSACARTTEPAGIAQFKALVRAIHGASQGSAYPPPVQASYRVRSPYLRYPARWAPGSAQLAIDLPGPGAYWTPVGSVTLADLRSVARR